MILKKYMILIILKVLNRNFIIVILNLYIINCNKL